MKPIPPEIAELVWKRDGYQCQLCGRRLNRGEGVIHHLIKRSEFIPANLNLRGHNDPRNLILLCGECHVAVHNSPELLKDLRYFLFSRF